MNGEASITAFGPSVTDILQFKPHEFLQPSQDLHSAILALSKYYLDPVASTVSATQQQRLQATRRSRKRKRKHDSAEENVLRLKSIAVEGFDAHQVWEQAKRISAAVDVEVQRAAEVQKDAEAAYEESSHDSSDEDEEEVDESISDDEEETEHGLEHPADLTESDEDEDIQDEDFDDESDQATGSRESPKNKTHIVEDKFGLNDPFFSIDDFNRRTEMLEQQDFKGDPDPDAASDEEDIEWDMDPMAATAQNIMIGKPELNGLSEEDDESDQDEHAGPTFGDMDLDAPEGESDDELDEDQDVDLEGADGSNANNFMYRDFFDPPARQKSKKEGKQRKAPTKARPGTRYMEDEALSEPDIQQTISTVHRDLFSDESEVEEEEEVEEKQVDPSSLSTHEQRKAAILTQIRELEAVNVAKRPWVLAGEARAQDRPLNALLEEDLDFERTGKPLPVITAETSEEIEELIKRRILAAEFDEVRKRRPDEALADSARRGRLMDINFDNPERKGLADMYEEEHLRKTDPTYVDQRSQKLKKEHSEIEALWKDVSSKLDSLASFRYRPRPVEVTIAVRTDAPAMSLEDARPSGVGGDIGTLGQLAPQEVYAPGEVKEKGKVATRGGQVVDQAEMTREERKRRRRRDKERAKKAAGQRENARKDTKQGTRAKVTSDLKKGGVKVIGKKGELRDVEGNEVKETVRRGAGSFKL